MNPHFERYFEQVGNQKVEILDEFVTLGKNHLKYWTLQKRERLCSLPRSDFFISYFGLVSSFSFCHPRRSNCCWASTSEGFDPKYVFFLLACTCATQIPSLDHLYFLPPDTYPTLTHHCVLCAINFNGSDHQVQSLKENQLARLCASALIRLYSLFIAGTGQIFSLLLPALASALLCSILLFNISSCSRFALTTRDSFLCR